ncbi:hypothetical protein CRM73_01430 [Kocuria sp. CCUG 69068]|uniref:TIR domain-containing protein n=1 Tax=Kocuria sp. CCUG 69068 TaxID=2043138 RepID=UPI001E3B3A36|nr:hypothetical protein [Kocuria sp. CCUG 69068]
MADGKGFWSYVHADDNAEGGRIAQLARDVVAQFEMITGDSIDLFLDRDELQWGDDWRNSVDESLASIAFFIPVITPRYFQSPECRRELNYFARRAQRLGLEELIMPILYIDFPRLRQDPSDDDAMDLIKRFQWEDWTDLRYESTTSPDYRRAVGRMATRLAEANVIADQADIAQAAGELPEEEDDAPGTVDLMAQAEEALPEWAETLEAIGEEIGTVAEIFVSGKADVEAANSSPKAFAARLTVFRKMANALAEPAGNIFEHSEQFTKQLNDVDQGITIMIQQVPAELQDNPEFKQEACGFFDSVLEMASSADAGLGSLKQMIDVMEPIEAKSRDLRAPMKLMRRGLTSMYEGRKIINGWVDLIERTGVECGA